MPTKNPLWLILIITMLLVSIDLGLAGLASGSITAVIFSLLMPWATPYILITLATIQDAPGHAGHWWYTGFILVSLVFMLQNFKLFFFKKLDHKISPVTFYLLFLWIVILFAIAMSWFYTIFGLLEQSEKRPFLMVGGLMIFMPFIGIFTYNRLTSSPNTARFMKAFVTIIIAHGLIIAAIQMVYDPGFLSSNIGRTVIEDAAQLTEKTALGFARAHGTYLTPNGFALCYILLFMILWVRFSDQQKAIYFNLKNLVVFGVISMTFGIMTLSKSMLAYCAILNVIILISVLGQKTGVTKWFVLIFLLSLVMLLLFPKLDLENLQEAFRLREGGVSNLGYRSEAWLLILQTFRWHDWILGTGLSHWPVFFQENLGFSLSDPHSLIFSLPGTFGVLGILFFMALILQLIRKSFLLSGQSKILAYALLLMFLFKDLVSIPYLIGSTPLTFMIWILLAHILNAPIKRELLR